MRREEEERVSVSGETWWTAGAAGSRAWEKVQASFGWHPGMQEGCGNQSELGLGFEEGLTKQKMKK